MMVPILLFMTISSYDFLLSCVDRYGNSEKKINLQLCLKRYPVGSLARPISHSSTCKNVQDVRHRQYSQGDHKW